MAEISYTIIIPHYNIPELLVRCLKSIPVRDDIQVIVIDDCSPNADTYFDRFPELSRPYLEYYSTPQGGSAGRARNIGLDHAKGKWLIFADADDFFTPCFDQILTEYAQSDYDIVFFSANSLDTDTYRNSNRDNYYCGLVDDYLVTGYDYQLRYKFDVPWAKMVKRELVETNGIKFQETLRSNDVAFSYLSGYYAKKIFADKRAIYCVTTRENSTSTNESFEAIKARMFVILSKYAFLREKGLSPDYPDQITQIIIKTRLNSERIALMEMINQFNINRTTLNSHILIYYLKVLVRPIVNLFR